MNRLLTALCTTVPALALAACAGGYGLSGPDYVGGPYAYDGYYDDHYGAFYDGYWGNNGSFYYRGGANERRYRRGNPSHFSRSGAGGSHFHSMQGSMTPAPGIHMPHFNGGQGRTGATPRGRR